jgi:hypothetical protein
MLRADLVVGREVGRKGINFVASNQALKEAAMVSLKSVSSHIL